MKTTNKKTRRLSYQRLSGLLILLACALIIFLASKGTTIEDRDITAIFFMLPLSFICLFTKATW